MNFKKCACGCFTLSVDVLTERLLFHQQGESTLKPSSHAATPWNERVLFEEMSLSE